MNKIEITEFVKKSLHPTSSKFTGQIVLVINVNQGGVTDVEKSVKERLK